MRAFVRAKSASEMFYVCYFHADDGLPGPSRNKINENGWAEPKKFFKNSCAILMFSSAFRLERAENFLPFSKQCEPTFKVESISRQTSRNEWIWILFENDKWKWRFVADDFGTMSEVESSFLGLFDGFSIHGLTCCDRMKRNLFGSTFGRFSFMERPIRCFVAVRSFCFCCREHERWIHRNRQHCRRTRKSSMRICFPWKFYSSRMRWVSFFVFFSLLLPFFYRTFSRQCWFTLIFSVALCVFPFASPLNNNKRKGEEKNGFRKMYLWLFFS